MYSPPDRPLIVKCTFDKWHKRITFSSARNCSYDLLRRKVEQCFSLYAASYAVAYKDDDGEITNIATDNDLFEAIQYFQAGDDAPLSSAASILSGRSFGARKITLRVHITVDYDGPSLSDTSSLASLEEFKGRNGSQQSFSFGVPSVDLDDDSVTVSSRDPGTSSAQSTRALGNSLTSIAKQKSFTSNLTPRLPPGQSLNGRSRSDQMLSRLDHSYGGPSSSIGEGEFDAVAQRYPADPSAVFERLKLSETLRDDASSLDLDSLAASDRGAAWLRDQNERTIRSMLGALPEPSDSDGLSLSMDSQVDPLGGDLALERDPRGKYYYTYTAGSCSQFQGSIEDEGNNGISDGDAYVHTVSRGPRPSSMQLNWLAAQQIESAENQRRNHDLRSISIQEETNPENSLTIDKDFLPFLPIPGPQNDLLTDCSNCGVLLDAIRYVCSTCGEKSPACESEKGKEKDASPSTTYSYPPPTHKFFSSPNSSSSRTYVGSSESLFDAHRHKPLPSIPSAPSLPSLHSIFHSNTRRYLDAPASPSSSVSPGYELCSGCLESAGIHHAIEAGLAAPGSSPVIGQTHDDPQRALQRRRAAPKKGQLRHAYQEKAWGHLGWEDVVQDEVQISQCSTCSAVTPRKRYKCASCPKMHLCRACYSQVHELHPSHAFLVVPDKPQEIPSASDYLPNAMPDPHEELSLKHIGVKCAHCLLDIVGARFHCAICDSVDICANCESAGLPGNLDSSDGGHISSHILIKIPYPLETTELQNASRRALHLWTGRDAASVGHIVPRSKANSEISSYAQTLIGSGTRDGLSQSPDDHRIFCDHCHHSIIGVRYQCGHCPSSPSPYSLCSGCEEKSYTFHDPMHIFFKLPRPVDRSLEPRYAILPPLYKVPAGPHANVIKPNDPRAYLSSLVHSSAICDRCMTCIEGEWFRCCYCARDLCDACEEVDTHNDKHIFLVFKSLVDMQLFKNFANLDNPNGSPPVISYPVYR
ncbi:hypothetical protein B0H34DRAFT_703960 [Crassisporium funariophilum]|nr:hypothetical protein B0H34DRAFT_703960 [Crassisporium funariophilum]